MIMVDNVIRGVLPCKSKKAYVIRGSLYQTYGRIAVTYPDVFSHHSISMSAKILTPKFFGM